MNVQKEITRRVASHWSLKATATIVNYRVRCQLILKEDLLNASNSTDSVPLEAL
jgi:hypothetical protein